MDILVDLPLPPLSSEQNNFGLPGNSSSLECEADFNASEEVKKVVECLINACLEKLDFASLPHEETNLRLVNSPSLMECEETFNDIEEVKKVIEHLINSCLEAHAAVVPVDMPLLSAEQNSSSAQNNAYRMKCESASNVHDEVREIVENMLDLCL